MRTASTSEDRFDLLPFIAIMLCLLGCLLFVTMSTAALSLGPAAGEGWLPVTAAGGATKQPVLLEWDGVHVRAHLAGFHAVRWSADRGLRIVEGRVVLSEPVREPDQAEFERLLAHFSERLATHYALFAVRPSGFESFQRLADAFRRRKIEVGYEPIAQSRPVRLLQPGGQP